jgi:hypothetical protein
MRTRFVVLVACLVAGGAVIGSSLAHVHGHGGAKPTSPTLLPLEISLTGSDNGPCSAARPCLTFQHAYDLAQPGQVVEVAAGEYPAQTLQGTKAAPQVVFRPAVGASVTVDGFDVYASNLVLSSFTTPFWRSYSSSDGFTALALNANAFIIFGSSNTKVLGGNYGPSFGNGSPTFVNFITYDNGTVAPHNVLVDGAYFHDYRLGTPDDHVQCIMVSGGDGVTIRDSRFQRCDGYSIFFTQWSGPAPPTNILLENNFFDQSTNNGSYTECCTYYSVFFSQAMSAFQNITVRYNSARQEIAFAKGVPVENVQEIANVAPLGSCLDGAVYLYNVWDGRVCSRTDRNASPGWVDPANFDLHLAPGSAAINRGDPKIYPARDIDGHKRPLGKRPDAGAAELR